MAPPLRTIFLGLALLSGSLAAQTTDQYGAIVYSPVTGQHGYSNHNLSKREAFRQATAECDARSPEAECEEIIWFREACGALAAGSTRAYGAAWNTDRDLAEQQALRHCSKWDQQCRVIRSFCTEDEALPVPAPVPEVRIVEPPPTAWAAGDERVWVVMIAALLIVLSFLGALRAFFKGIASRIQQSEQSEQSEAQAGDEPQSHRLFLTGRNRRAEKPPRIVRKPLQNRAGMAHPAQPVPPTLPRPVHVRVVKDLVRERRKMRERARHRE